jgi:hypothetical protein
MRDLPKGHAKRPQSLYHAQPGIKARQPQVESEHQEASDSGSERECEDNTHLHEMPSLEQGQESHMIFHGKHAWRKGRKGIFSPPFAFCAKKASFPSKAPDLGRFGRDA